MMIVHWIIFLTPIGIFGLIAYRIGAAGGGSQLWQLISEISKYFFTVLGRAFYSRVYYPSHNFVYIY